MPGVGRRARIERRSRGPLPGSASEWKAVPHAELCQARANARDPTLSPALAASYPGSSGGTCSTDCPTRARIAPPMNKTRLEAFSDGVLAIIITIMVLELQVPHG